MKFEVSHNDCLPAVEVVQEGDELLVRFFGFAWEEARQWFETEPVMKTFENCHSIVGDFEMRVIVKDFNLED